jgi:hypothetical protein
VAYKDKLAKAAGDALRGETIVAGCKALPKGKLGKRAIGAGLGGAIGGMIAGGTGDDSGTVSFPTAANMSLGLTPTRLLIWQNSAMTGGPKEIIGEVPLEAVTAVEGGAKRVVGVKTGTVSFTLTDGSVVELEIPRVGLSDGDELVAAVQAAIANRS